MAIARNICKEFGLFHVASIAIIRVQESAVYHDNFNFEKAESAILRPWSATQEVVITSHEASSKEEDSSLLLVHVSCNYPSISSARIDQRVITPF